MASGKKFLGIFSRRQAGFTLVELLVAVGITVALAAVIIPNVARFANKGTQGATVAEMDNVQAAMDTMMSEEGIDDVTPLTGPALSTNTWTALPAGPGAAFLSEYLREDTTKYWYCYDDAGKITRQDTTAAAACP